MVDPIEIALAADANYRMGLLVTVCSLARHADSDAAIRFSVIDGGLQQEDWDFLCRKALELHPKSMFNRLTVDMQRFAAFKTWNGDGRMTYARLLLPELMPGTRHVIYCDADFLWLADVAELWTLRRADVVCLGVPDGTEVVIERERKWFAAHGFPFDGMRYFCAGMCLLNLDLCRQMDVAGKCISFLSRWPDAQFPDQTALNAVLGERPSISGVTNLVLLPEKWHRLSRVVTAADLKDGCAIHYAGDAPWQRAGWYAPLSDVVMLWYREYGRILGIGTWRALCRFNGAMKAVFLRGVSLALTVPVLRSISYWIIEDIRRATIGDELRAKNRRLGIGLA